MIWLMPLPTQNPVISCFTEIQNDFTFVILAYPVCLGKEAINNNNNNDRLTAFDPGQPG